LGKANVPFAAIDNTEPATIEDADKVEVNIKGVPAEKAGTLSSIVKETFPAWTLNGPVNGTDYKMRMRATDALALRQSTVKRSIDTIETRVNGLGLAESAVQQRGRSDGESEILVQLPGVDDPARIKQILQTAAMLELYEVKDGPFATEEEARAKHGGVLPLNTKLIKGMGRSEGNTGWLLVTRNPVIRGTDLRDAKPAQGEMPGQWETSFVLTQDAAKRFERYTEANIGNRLAIVLDNQWRSAPTIQNKISDSGRIMGAANQQDASDLALVLRAGSLPASLVYLEERTVGPSLGADSIRQGILAGIVGVAAVVFVMLVYYRRSGINATLALILNAVILIAALSYFEAVLTLPGIAGVILTIGMAVDSNVLIFERIREELRSGKAVVSAVDAGFSKALTTIIDTHVTTVVSCAVLFIFGTGPVKGFAVTLVIGLVANVFTAVFVSKFIFEWELSGKRQLTTLSI
jgi:preprotein translocase subunit SecD